MLWLAVPGGLLAQNASISGTVGDSSISEPIFGASLAIAGTSHGTSTDPVGHFDLTGLPQGSYVLEISYLGYQPKTIPVELAENQNMTLNIALVPTTFRIADITVQDARTINETMTKINAIDIHLRPTRTSQDVLRQVPGLFIAQHAGGGKAEQIFLRGFDIDHGTDIELTVDGMPVNMVSHAHGQGYADLHWLIPEIIKGVDFNKGPYYAGHGDFTTAGYASFKTKNRLDKSMVKLEAGRFDTYRAVALIDLLKYAKQVKNHHLYFAGEYQFSNGPFESPQNFNRLNLWTKYRANLADNNLLTITASHFDSRWDASGQIPQRAVDTELIDRFGAIDDTEGGNTSRSNVNMELTTLLDKNKGVLKNQGYYSHYDFELFSNFTFFLEDSINGDQIQQKEDRHLMGYNGSYQMEHGWKQKRVVSKFGWGGRYDRVNDNQLSHTMNRDSILERLAFGDVQQVNAFAYIDERLHFGDKFSIQAALRFDQFYFQYLNRLDDSNKNEQTHFLSPKLNFFYTPVKDFQLYIKTGMGFHSNDARVVVAQGGGRYSACCLWSRPGDFLQTHRWFISQCSTLVPGAGARICICR